MEMPVLALITWIITALGGLYLLAIWLIEYDPDFQRAAATRLPVPVISAHVLFALGGLALWLMYLITDEDIFAWGTIAVLAFVATFGLTMAVRWIGVYRAGPVRDSEAAMPMSQGSAALAVPPERHFPVSVVIGHGIFATATIILVVLTILGVGGS
jgi:hypothetical protein